MAPGCRLDGLRQEIERRHPPQKSSSHARLFLFVMLLCSYLVVNLSLKAHVLQTEPAAADVSARRLAIPGFTVAGLKRSVGSVLAAAASLEPSAAGEQASEGVAAGGAAESSEEEEEEEEEEDEEDEEEEW